MLPEVLEKFQTDLELFGEALVERIQELLPDLSPEEQESTPILMSDTAFATCLIEVNRGMTIDAYAVYGGEGCIFKCDISLSNNNLTFSLGDFVGITSTWVDYWNDRNVILENADHWKWNIAHEGEITARIWDTGFDFRLYYEGAYHDTDISLDWNIPLELADCKQYNTPAPTIRTGNSGIVSYTVDADDVITCTPDRDLNPNNYNTLLFAIKGYPIIMNSSDTTYINQFVSNNDAANNYSTTYTTPDNKTITVYYGDNYIITHVNNNDPVSYDDIKNALNIAVNQINDDNDTDMSVPDYPVPPVPPDIDDDIEVDMPLNDAAFGTGLSHYYVTTVAAPVLEDISEAMSTWDINATGKDLYRNLLSCRITKVGPIPAKNSTFVIYGEELLHNGSPISINEITGNPSMDLGEYEILPKFNDFRDYAPYTKIEMYIPYCGWVALPSHCMSSEEKPKIITGTLLCDIIAGTCKAVIKCNDTVVAEASGFTAIDVPFTGENVGMKMAGIANSITSYGNTAAKTVGSIAGGIGGGSGGAAGAAAAGGVVSLVGSFAQMYGAFNSNYTEICGKTGDGCNVAGLNKVYIKIQRPKTAGFEEPDFVPGNYGHTTGFMCMKQCRVGDCKGLIVAANVDTSGIAGATDAERAEIKRVLETGLIVNAAPE